LRFILFVVLISYPAFAMFAPPMGPHTGMDPICLIALQAGMSGRSTQQQLSLEDRIVDVEARLESLEDEVDEDRTLLENDVFKNSVCRNNQGECPQLSDGSQKKIKAKDIVDNTIKHVLGKKSAPAKCARVASEGVTFYFESFLPHIHNLNLPLTLIGPTVAVAIDAASSTSGDMEVGVEEVIVPNTLGDGGGEPANACGECTDVRDNKCYIPSLQSNGTKMCPRGWSMSDDSDTCYKDCEEGLELPPPGGGSCTEDDDCDLDKRCDTDTGACVDRCTDEKTPKWDEDEGKCVCAESSCGKGKVCNDKGECEDEPLSAPSPSPFDWCENCDCRYKRYFEDEGQVDIDGLCEDPLLLITDADGDIDELARDDCKDYLQYIVENLREINELEEERKRLVRKQEKEERTRRRLARKCERNPNLEICQQRNPGVTEAGTFCTSCFQEVIEAAYPKRSAWDKILSAVVPLAGTGLAYYGVKETNKLRSRQGFPVDNSAMYGLAYPFITSMLYGGALTGRGRNALACSPTAHMNPYGGIFSAYAQLGGGMIPGVMPGIQGGFLQGGIPVPGYAGGMVGGMPFFGSGGNLYANMGLFGPGAFGSGAFGPGAFGPGAFGPGAFGSGAFGPGAFGPGAFGPGAFGPGAFGPGAFGSGAFGSGAFGPGAFGSGAFGPGGGAGGFDYYSHMQMQQRMQSYYMQLQQFQMEQQRVRQSIIMRYQQEAQSLAIKYQTFLRNMSQPGNYPYPPPPGDTPPYLPLPYPSPPGGTTSGYPNPYQ